LDSLLWLQKQYTEVKDIFQQEIDKNTYLNDINKISDIDEIIISHDIKKILKMVYSIPKKQ
jgi:hypothetical protein